jgi:hypothetical protein
MCPACVTTLALIAAGGSSTGAIGALVMNKLCGKRTKPRDKDSDTYRRDAWQSERGALAAERAPLLAERELRDNEEGLAR